MNKGKRYSSSADNYIRKNKGWIHPNHTVPGAGGLGVQLPTQYIGNRFRGSTGDVLRPTEWSLIGLDAADKVQVDFHKWFKTGQIDVPNYHSPGNETSVNAKVAVGTGAKCTGFQTLPAFRRPGYEYRGGGPPFARFKFRISIKDPNGTNGERITGPESEIVTVRSSPHPVFWDEANEIWDTNANTGILVSIGAKGKVL